MPTVFQEQAMLLYVIAGLLLVLNVVAIGVWLRLGDIRSALKWAPRDDSPKMSGVRVPDRH